MHGDRHTGISLLALLYTVSGGLCTLGALDPHSPATPVLLLSALAVVGLGGGAALWLVRLRAGAATVHVALGVYSGLIALLAWRSATTEGVAGLGPAMIAVGGFAGHFLHRAAARWHIAGLLVLASIGAAAAAPTVSGTWAVVPVAVIALGESQAGLSRQLRHAADTDPLTGLPNRRAWEAAAVRNLAHAERSGEPVTIAVLDLDRFKQVNDEDGHSAGDDLLRALAQAWSVQLRTADLLGRLGGDEFVLCLPDTDAAAAAELIARLRDSHPAPWSAGTATALRREDLSALLHQADAQLYEQKRARAR